MLPDTIDPRFTSFFLDTCAFDPKYSPEHEAAEELWERHRAGSLNLELAHSNQREIEHPNTPGWVKRRAQEVVYTIEVPLTPAEQQQKAEVLAFLTGNAQSDKHRDDAEHLFEAIKYGRYFVTTDRRLLSKAEALYGRYNVRVCKPSDVIDRLQRGAA